MNAAFSHNDVRGTRVVRRSAFTLIELLVVIAIIALLLAILLPSLARAREHGKAMKCQANIHSMAQSTAMYMDNDDQPILPWYHYPAYGGNCSNGGGTYGITLFTPWIFGGFPAPNPDPIWSGYRVDATLYPTQIRELNAYVGSGERNKDEIELYKCPGDRTHTTAIIGQGGSVIVSEPRTSWEANGSSYTLNTRFMQGYTWPPGTFGLGCGANQTVGFGKRIGPHMVGGKASRFILWLEQGAYSAFYQAGPNRRESLAHPQREGWHREFSKWSAGFADGHGEYRYMDTRVAIHPDWTVWQPDWRPNTP